MYNIITTVSYNIIHPIFLFKLTNNKNMHIIEDILVASANTTNSSFFTKKH